MESKVLAALAKRADVEAGHRYDGGHAGSLRARSSNLGGFASRSESMSSLAGHPDLHSEHHPERPEKHGRGGRPTGCCLAAIAALLLLLGVVLLLRQRGRAAAHAADIVDSAAQRQPAPLATVTAAAVAAGLSKAGTRCSQLCLDEANALLRKQPDMTEGARGAAYDSCFAHCAAASPADSVEGVTVRTHRKVAAGAGAAGRAAAMVAAGQSAGRAVRAEQQQREPEQVQ